MVALIKARAIEWSTLEAALLEVSAVFLAPSGKSKSVNPRAPKFYVTLIAGLFTMNPSCIPDLSALFGVLGKLGESDMGFQIGLSILQKVKGAAGLPGVFRAMVALRGTLEAPLSRDNRRN